jgi:hypothetical protein
MSFGNEAWFANLHVGQDGPTINQTTTAPSVALSSCIFLMFTCLLRPKTWDGYLKAIQHFSAGHVLKQDWTNSSVDELAARKTAQRRHVGGIVWALESGLTMPGVLHAYDLANLAH